jgi:hypothetical protein
VVPFGEFVPVADVGGAVEEGRDQPATEEGVGVGAVSLVVTRRGCGEDVWVGGLARER